MATTWFLCPYDVVDTGGGPLRFRRLPGIKRFFPAENDPVSGVRWEEAETLGNHCIVKVVGPDAALVPVRADNDFTEFDPLTTIPPNRRTFVRNKLENLGFNQAEIDATGYTITGILNLLTTACGIIGLNQTGTGLEVKPGRRVSPKTVAQVEARSPG